MQSQASQIQRSLETILKDQPLAPNTSLRQLLPEQNFSKKSEQLKRNISDFVQDCLENDKLTKEMIDLVLKTDVFNSQYEKNLALFSVQVLSGDICDAYKLFIKIQQLGKSVRRTKSIRNEQEIQQQIQVQTSKIQDPNVQKYENFRYLMNYIRRQKSQISFVCMNYFTKIMNHVISNRAQHVYAYFATQDKDRKQNIKTDMQYLLQHAYNYGGVSEMLGKMLAQQGSTNKYLESKKQIVQGVLNFLKSQELIKKSPQNYQYLLDFVEYVLSRTKYKSDDQTQQLANICQKFVDQNVVWHFYQKLTTAVLGSNNLINNNANLNNSGTIAVNENPKCSKPQNQLKTGVQDQFQSLENIFQNSINYLKILVQRINYDEETDKYSNQTQKAPQPALDFQVNQALFGQNSLFEMMTLQIPFQYKSMNKMLFYEFLLKLSRNSNYSKDANNHMGLQSSSLLPILTHLLKMFRRQSKKNGLVNFYIQEIIFQAILPKMQKLDSKQAMMVLSALNPSQQILKYEDTRAYLKKIILILSKKCQWFTQHFDKLGIDVNKVKQNYLIKLGGHSHVYTDKKNTARQLSFLNEQIKNEQAKNPQQKETRKSQKFEDDSNSSSSSSQQQKKNQEQFKTNREFQYPKDGLKSIETEKLNLQNLDVQQNLFKTQKLDEKNREKQGQQSQIIEQIRLVESGEISGEFNKQNQQEIKQKLMELLLDSAGEQDGQQYGNRKANKKNNDKQ